MEKINQLIELKKTLNKLSFPEHSLSTYHVKEYTTYAIKHAVNGIQKNKNLKQLEEILLFDFNELEEVGWTLNDSNLVLYYWFEIAQIIGIDNFEEKLNHIDKRISIADKIENLRKFKASYTIPNTMGGEAPIFYSALHQILLNSLDEIITQIEKSPRIDFLLKVFDKSLDIISELTTKDHDFGDTVDREQVCEFYSQIREILKFKYSRGLLSSKW